ncbi:MAG: AAA family ATPase [Terracidiphilus sp.]|jgi:type II secretory pathway predicted ATPase ExeA
MYRPFFGINDPPFGACSDPRFLYLMPQSQEVLSCLQYGVAARKGFVVMTGEVGTGKTTLLNSVLNSFEGQRISTAFVFNPRLDVLDFLEFVMADFGIPPAARTKSGMLLQLNRWLIERFRNGELCAIVIDDAQNLSWDLLEEIRLLTNLETASEKLLQIVLSGQPELEQKLRNPAVRQLRQRIALWCKTRPLSSEETTAYIARRLEVAGATHPIFSPDAIPLVHRYSKGIPRLINLICEHALVSAYVEEIKPVPARIVESVSAELELTPRPFVITPIAKSELHSNSLQTGISGTAGPIADPAEFLTDGEL